MNGLFILMLPESPCSSRDTCPAPEELGAFIDGTLDLPSCLAVQSHLSVCPRCNSVYTGITLFELLGRRST